MQQDTRQSADAANASTPEPHEAPGARVPTALDWRAWLSAGRNTIGQALALDTSLRCAGVAFFGFLSLFPALSAAVSLFGLVADPTAIAMGDLPLTDALPEDMTVVITEQVIAFSERETKLGIGLGVSLLIALWTGSRGMNALVFAITRAHKESDERGFLAGIVTSLLATVSAFVTLAIILTAVTVLPTIAMIWPFPQSREDAILWLRWPVVAAVLWVAVVLLYRHAPHRRSPRTRWVFPGAALATLLWLLGSAALSFFIENFGRYDATFGSIAAAAILMLWLYFSAIVLVSGATLNAELEWRTRRDTTVGPDRPMGERRAYVADTVADDVVVPMKRPSRDGGETNDRQRSVKP
ncbi:MAG: YihY/virulence factor BrkB family protein [Roseitalea porphyridii]|jgi:membrane protein|uniref:YihY/virulence factor BrkB family protein n=1 Tax=Roseitalea porphyridii TaxID=1852022 RepID=UPI0032EF9DB4